MLHALRTLRNWIGSTDYEQDESEIITVRAGSGPLQDWFEKGSLALWSAAVTPLSEDILSFEG